MVVHIYYYAIDSVRSYNRSRSPSFMALTAFMDSLWSEQNVTQ